MSPSELQPGCSPTGHTDREGLSGSVCLSPGQCSPGCLDQDIRLEPGDHAK